MTVQWLAASRGYASARIAVVSRRPAATVRRFLRASRPPADLGSTDRLRGKRIIHRLAVSSRNIRKRKATRSLRVKTRGNNQFNSGHNETKNSKVFYKPKTNLKSDQEKQPEKRSKSTKNYREANVKIITKDPTCNKPETKKRIDKKPNNLKSTSKTDHNHIKLKRNSKMCMNRSKANRIVTRKKTGQKHIQKKITKTNCTQTKYCQIKGNTKPDRCQKVCKTKITCEHVKCKKLETSCKRTKSDCYHIKQKNNETRCQIKRSTCNNHTKSKISIRSVQRGTKYSQIKTGRSSKLDYVVIPKTRKNSKQVKTYAKGTSSNKSGSNKTDSYNKDSSKMKKCKKNTSKTNNSIKNDISKQGTTVQTMNTSKRLNQNCEAKIRCKASSKIGCYHFAPFCFRINAKKNSYHQGTEGCGCYKEANNKNKQSLASENNTKTDSKNKGFKGSCQIDETCSISSHNQLNTSSKSVEEHQHKTVKYKNGKSTSTPIYQKKNSIKNEPEYCRCTHCQTDLSHRDSLRCQINTSNKSNEKCVKQNKKISNFDERLSIISSSKITTKTNEDDTANSSDSENTKTDHTISTVCCQTKIVKQKHKPCQRNSFIVHTASTKKHLRHRIRQVNSKCIKNRRNIFTVCSSTNNNTSQDFLKFGKGDQMAETKKQDVDQLSVNIKELTLSMMDTKESPAVANPGQLQKLFNLYITSACSLRLDVRVAAISQSQFILKAMQSQAHKIHWTAVFQKDTFSSWITSITKLVDAGTEEWIDPWFLLLNCLCISNLITPTYINLILRLPEKAFKMAKNKPQYCGIAFKAWKKLIPILPKLSKLSANKMVSILVTPLKVKFPHSADILKVETWILLMEEASLGGPLGESFTKLAEAFVDEVRVNRWQPEMLSNFEASLLKIAMIPAMANSHRPAFTMALSAISPKAAWRPNVADAWSSFIASLCQETSEEQAHIALGLLAGQPSVLPPDETRHQMLLIALAKGAFCLDSPLLPSLLGRLRDIFSSLIHLAEFREKVFLPLIIYLKSSTKEVSHSASSVLPEFWFAMRDNLAGFMKRDEKELTKSDIEAVATTLTVPLFFSSSLWNEQIALMERIEGLANRIVWSDPLRKSVGAALEEVAKDPDLELNHALDFAALLTRLDQDADIIGFICAASRRIVGSGAEASMEYLNLLDFLEQQKNLDAHKGTLRPSLSLLSKMAASYPHPYDVRIKDMGAKLLRKLSTLSGPVVTPEEPALRSPPAPVHVMAQSNFLHRLSRAEEKNVKRTVPPSSLFGTQLPDDKRSPGDKENDNTTPSKLALVTGEDSSSTESDWSSGARLASNVRVRTDFHRGDRSPRQVLTPRLRPADSSVSNPNNSPAPGPLPPQVEDLASQDFVFIAPKLKTASPLTEHQKEKMKSRRSDIPALYQDLSQDLSSQDMSSQDSVQFESSSKNSVMDLNEEAMTGDNPKSYNNNLSNTPKVNGELSFSNKITPEKDEDCKDSKSTNKKPEDVSNKNPAVKKETEASVSDVKTDEKVKVRRQKKQVAPKKFEENGSKKYLRKNRKSLPVKENTEKENSNSVKAPVVNEDNERVAETEQKLENSISDGQLMDKVEIGGETNKSEELSKDVMDRKTKDLVEGGSPVTKDKEQAENEQEESGHAPGENENRRASVRKLDFNQSEVRRSARKSTSVFKRTPGSKSNVDLSPLVKVRRKKQRLEGDDHTEDESDHTHQQEEIPDKSLKSRKITHRKSVSAPDEGKLLNEEKLQLGETMETNTDVVKASGLTSEQEVPPRSVETKRKRVELTSVENETNVPPKSVELKKKRVELTEVESEPEILAKSVEPKSVNTELTSVENQLIKTEISLTETPGTGIVKRKRVKPTSLDSDKVKTRRKKSEVNEVQPPSEPVKSASKKRLKKSELSENIVSSTSEDEENPSKKIKFLLSQQEDTVHTDSTVLEDQVMGVLGVNKENEQSHNILEKNEVEEVTDEKPESELLNETQTTEVVSENHSASLVSEDIEAINDVREQDNDVHEQSDVEDIDNIEPPELNDEISEDSKSAVISSPDKDTKLSEILKETKVLVAKGSVGRTLVMVKRIAVSVDAKNDNDVENIEEITQDMPSQEGPIPVPPSPIKKKDEVSVKRRKTLSPSRFSSSPKLLRKRLSTQPVDENPVTAKKDNLEKPMKEEFSFEFIGDKLKEPEKLVTEDGMDKTEGEGVKGEKKRCSSLDNWLIRRAAPSPPPQDETTAEFQSSFTSLSPSDDFIESSQETPVIGLPLSPIVGKNLTPAEPSSPETPLSKCSNKTEKRIPEKELFEREAEEESEVPEPVQESGELTIEPVISPAPTLLVRRNSQTRRARRPTQIFRPAGKSLLVENPDNPRYSPRNWPTGDMEPWVACCPTPPGSSPVTPILRRTPHDISPSSTPSKKRVRFVDPVVTLGLYYCKDESSGQVQYPATPRNGDLISSRIKIDDGDKLGYSLEEANDIEEESTKVLFDLSRTPDSVLSPDVEKVRKKTDDDLRKSENYPETNIKDQDNLESTIDNVEPTDQVEEVVSTVSENIETSISEDAESSIQEGAEEILQNVTIQDVQNVTDDIDSSLNNSEFIENIYVDNLSVGNVIFGSDKMTVKGVDEVSSGENKEDDSPGKKVRTILCGTTGSVVVEQLPSAHLIKSEPIVYSEWESMDDSVFKDSSLTSNADMLDNSQKVEPCTVTIEHVETCESSHVSYNPLSQFAKELVDANFNTDAIPNQLISAAYSALHDIIKQRFFKE